MAIQFLTKIFGSRNDRLLKQYSRTVREVNALEASLKSLTDEQLAARIRTDRARYGVVVKSAGIKVQ